MKRIFLHLFLILNLLPLNLPAAPDLKAEIEGKEQSNKVPQIKHKIPLEVESIIENEKEISEIRAKLQKVTEEGKQEGIDKMTLKGKIIDSKDTNEGKVVNIIWQKAGFKENEEEIEIPLQSKIGTSGKIEEGDKFVAKGDSSQLLQVWQKLKDKLSGSSQNNSNNTNSNNNSETAGKEQSQNFISSSGRATGVGNLASGSSTNSNNNSLPQDTIGFTTEEIITTTDGCDIRIDLTNNLAIVQTRQIQGSEEISSCADNSTTYSITADYSSCINYIDYNNKKVYWQYTLGYNNSDIGGRIQVQGCTPDYEKVADIVSDYSKCSYVHNFKEGYSIAQKRTLYYDENENEILIQGCHDDNTNKYLHIETEEGCSDQIEEGQVIWFTRNKINVKGEDIFISSCTPKDSAIEIHEEKCSSNPYTHDFESGQTFVNKDYFYYKDNIKIILNSCIASEEILTHKQEVGVCNITNDDDNKTSNIYSKTYIEDQGSKIFITDCQQSLSPIPYIKTKNKWVKNDTKTSVTSIITQNIYNSLKIGLSWGGAGYGIVNFYGNDSLQQVSPLNKYDSNKRLYCYKEHLKDIWVTTDDKQIDEANSDEWLDWDHSFSTVTANNNFKYVYINCSNVHCNTLTTLYKHPIYTRGDGSEFLDNSQILETKYVCGYGHLVDGTEEAF